ncbi:hypothetical protein [Emticicia sp. SJ17W-69]|uniref:hypothetical protein n=1 Tax=Emticicia sp. SJ17W-69 TaxID=3421657 RepID=UPI003EBDC9EC
MKYYLIGSAIITVAWILKCIFQTFPNSFPSLITFDNKNAFTFPDTYGELGTVLESIFMFIGISESHKQSELSNIDLKRKILLSIEEKGNDDKIFINVKQEILIKINTTFNQHLRQSSTLAEETLQLLKSNNNARAKENLLLFNTQTSQSIQTIRNIVREFNELNSLKFNLSIESKAYEISKYRLSEKNVSFDLYVNQSALWQTIGNDFEKQILTFYEKILDVFIKYKEFLHIIANFAMHNDGNIFVIIQDDGSKVASKNKMIYELNLLSTQLLYWQGKMNYSIEDSSSSTVRLDFISIQKKTTHE